MISELKLFSRTEDGVIDFTPFQSSADIEYDQFGFPIRCTSEEGLEQNLLKSVLTSTQSEDGYGTDFKSIIGKKNLDFIRVKLMQEILSSLSVLRKYQLDFLSKNPTYDKKNIIGSVVNIKTSQISGTSFVVSTKIRSQNDLDKNTDTLQESNITLNIGN